jgi:hypothetical protein
MFIWGGICLLSSWLPFWTNAIFQFSHYNYVNSREAQEDSYQTKEEMVYHLKETKKLNT